MSENGKQTFIKVAGEKYAYCAINVTQNNDWVEFDRVNTKTNEVSGHLKVNKSQVLSIEDREEV